MTESTRKRSLPQLIEDSLTSFPGSPPNLDKRARLDLSLISSSAPSLPSLPSTPSLSPSLSLSPIECLPSILIQLIAQFLPPRVRMAHLPHLSNTFPSITSMAFQEDHITLTSSLMESMASSRVRELLSAVPAMTYESRVNVRVGCYQEWFPFYETLPFASPSVLPPFFPGLKECILSLNGDPMTPVRQMGQSHLYTRRRVTVTQLIQELASCPLLSVFSLTMDYDFDVKVDNDSSIIDRLQSFPSLRTLVLKGMRCDLQTVSLLLSLPLLVLDIAGLTVYTNQRSTVYPCSLTLQTLCIPAWSLHFVSLLHPYTELTGEGSGLRHLEVGSGEDEGLPEFLRSCPSLSALRLVRCWRAGWSLDTLVPPNTRPFMSRLQHLACIVEDHWEEAGPSVLTCIRLYADQLLTLVLNFTYCHDLSKVLRRCMQCRRLRTLTLRDIGEEEEEDERNEANAIAKLPSTYRGLPSLRFLGLESKAVRTEVHLLAILTACPNIHHLRMESVDFLTLGVLPAIGRKCRCLRSLRLSSDSATIFLPTTLAVQNLARQSSVSSFPSSAATEGLFPHLTDLHVIYGAYHRQSVARYDPSVLCSLVSLLTPSPLTTLRLGVKLREEHFAIFEPLQRLVELDVQTSAPFIHQSRVRRSRRQAQHFMTRDLITSEWSVDGEIYPNNFGSFFGFDPEPRWRLKKEGQERWINGREAFFSEIARFPNSRTAPHPAHNTVTSSSSSSDAATRVHSLGMMEV